jgi:hypothetical protein
MYSESQILIDLHRFTKNFRRDYEKIIIKLPDEDELQGIMATYARLGFMGAIGNFNTF